MLSVSRLSKRYGKHVAVQDLTFSVGKGEIVGFLGPNGAGKSTTLRILAGILAPTSGTAKILGADVVDEPERAKAVIGYMPENVPLYPEMRVREYLTFRAELKGLARRTRRTAVDGVLEEAHVADVASTTLGHLSKGYRQRVGLADALLGRPPLLLLDEPMAGLDPNQIHEVRDVLGRIGKEHTVLLSTHLLSEVEAVATRLLVLHRGTLVSEGTLEEIRGASSSLLEVEVRLASEDSAEENLVNLVRALGEFEEVRVARADGPLRSLSMRWRRETEVARRDRVTEELVLRLVHAGIFVRGVRPRGGSLEEVFRGLTLDDQVERDEPSA